MRDAGIDIDVINIFLGPWGVRVNSEGANAQNSPVFKHDSETKKYPHQSDCLEYTGPAGEQTSKHSPKTFIFRRHTHK